MKKRRTSSRKSVSKKSSRGGSFKGKIKANAAKRKAGASFGHLIVPSGISVFVPEPNTKVIMDILPYKVTNKKHIDRNERNDIATVGSFWFKSPYKTHGNIGANKDKAVCGIPFGKKCYPCEYQAELRKKKKSDEEIKALKTSDRNLYAVHVISIDGVRVKKPVIQIFDFSDYLFQEMFENQLGDEPEFDYFPDLDEGVSLKVAFGEGSYMGHKYPEPTRFDFIPRKKALPEGIEDKVPELDKCIELLSYEVLKDKFNEVAEEADEDEDEEEMDERPRKKKKINKKFVADDEEDEDYDDEDEDFEDEEDGEDYDDEDDDLGDDDDYDDEEDEEEEDLDDEEEEDYDDEEDEEEEEPVRKKRTSKKRPEKSSKKLKCEYGHRFGRDYNKYDDCDDCEIARKCKAARK